MPDTPTVQKMTTARATQETTQHVHLDLEGESEDRCNVGGTRLAIPTHPGGAEGDTSLASSSSDVRRVRTRRMGEEGEARYRETSFLPMVSCFIGKGTGQESFETQRSMGYEPRSISSRMRLADSCNLYCFSAISRMSWSNASIVA